MTIPWPKLSKETQKAILTLFVMSGGAATTRCCPPRNYSAYAFFLWFRCI